jgi:hypothetical protein
MKSAPLVTAHLEEIAKTHARIGGRGQEAFAVQEAEPVDQVGGQVHILLILDDWR